jgi:hypothetical protein
MCSHRSHSIMRRNSRQTARCITLQNRRKMRRFLGPFCSREQMKKKKKQNTYIMRLEDHFSIHRIDLAALAGITQVRVAD